MSSVNLKQLIFAVIRYTGFYKLVRRFYRHKLLILCYHGISVKDEHEWWPGVFMEKNKFQSRMALVKSLGFTPMTLDVAVNGLEADTLPSHPLVITADDGYLNSPETLARICKDFDLPLTIYVTSYHSKKESPIFNVVIQYLLWKAGEITVEGPFPHYFGAMCAEPCLTLNTPARAELANSVISYGREKLDDAGRSQLIEEFAKILGVNYEALKEVGAFRLMGREEIKTAHGMGVDIQLHTHRHHLPVDRKVVLKEIEENRAYLEPLTDTRLNHFCYPSGQWDRQQWEWLKEVGVRSATTCHIGFNDKNSPLLALNRYLDNNNITTNEFVAEVSGANDFIRSMVKRLKPGR